MRLSKKTVLGLSLAICFSISDNVGFAQDEELIDKVAGKAEYEFQQMTEQDAIGDINTLRQFIADSMRLVYDERFHQELDSLESICESKVEQLESERDRIIDLNKALTDSLNKYAYQKPSDDKAGFDANLESRYFQYEKRLKMDAPKRKAGFFKMSTVIENIAPFQIEELNGYFDIFYPNARTDSVLDFIIQLNIRESDWANAGRNIIKFLYLFPNSSLYEEIKNVRAGIFQSEKYYKPYVAYLTELFNALPQLPQEDVRYFRYVELLKDFPDQSVRNAFLPEARKFLNLYPGSKYAPDACIWIAETLRNANQPHSAFLTLQKTMTLYPDYVRYSYALLTSGIIQQEQFNEYENAVSTFASLIQSFPEDTLAEDAQYRLAKIYDENLKNYEQAVNEYQIYADKYPQTPNAIPALMRKATIQATQMNLVEEAVKTYKSIDEHYAATVGAQNALSAAGDLYYSKTRYDQAIEVYMNIFQKYPQSENAVAGLEKVVDIYQAKIKDNQKSIEVLNLIIINYPDSKASARATKLLKKLEKVK